MTRLGVRAAGLGLALSVALVAAAPGARAEAPLHQRIDAAIEAKLGGPVAPPATDAELARRVYLDLIGMIPTADEARAFLDDPSPYKRARLVDRLIASPEHARRLATLFDVMWMERRADQHVPAADWRQFLRDAFANNVPYDALTRAVLAADGTEPATRPAAKFTLDREAQPNLLTRDIGRLFLGIDLQCAQCHDHPLVDDYKQADYYGIYAFLNRSSLFNDEKAKQNVVAEKADGDVTFTSVFKKKVTHKTGPRLLSGSELAEPTFGKGLEYLVAPADKVRPIPRYSRRAQLPGALTSGKVAEFDRNIVNRVWAMLMGRGLVQPLDLHHSDNPPSHPELLDLLAREFASARYDINWLIREIALSRIYQASSEPPPGSSAEVAEASRFAVAALRPLSPEQLAWSVMQATGIVAATQAEAENQFDVVDPRMRDILRTDAKRQALRADLVEAFVYGRLNGNTGPFVSQFASGAGQAQDGGEPTVHQALFLANGQPIQSWLAPSGNNLSGRLLKLTDPSALAEELYLSLLSRRPTADERAEVAGYLGKPGKDRTQAVQELAWALLASTEFRFNH